MSVENLQTCGNKIYTYIYIYSNIKGAKFKDPQPHQPDHLHSQKYLYRRTSDVAVALAWRVGGARSPGRRPFVLVDTWTWAMVHSQGQVAFDQQPGPNMESLSRTGIQTQHILHHRPSDQPSIQVTGERCITMASPLLYERPKPVHGSFLVRHACKCTSRLR